MLAILDTSALLAFLQNEPGAEKVGELLTTGARCSSVNWSEVAQKVRAGGGDWRVAAAILLSFSIKVVPATIEDAEAAAGLWERGSGLSLADRFCLALRERLGGTAWTADTAWGSSDQIRQIR